MNNLIIPEQWKSKRQRIIEIYIIERKSVPEIAHILGYVSQSFPRLVIQEYRQLVRGEETEKQTVA